MSVRTIDRSDVSEVLHADVETEARLLAIMMARPDTILDVAGHYNLDTDAFVRPAHQIIYGAIRRLYVTDQPIDEATVWIEVDRAGEAGRMGGPSYLHTIMAGYTTASSAGYYAERLVELRRRRRAIELARRALQSLQDPHSDLNAALERLTDGLAHVEPAGADARAESSWAPVDIDAVLAGKAVVAQPEILARVDGQCLIYPSKMHTFQGESESLKSWLLQWACTQQINDGCRVLYLDFEDDAANVVGRLRALGAEPQAIAETFTYVRPTDPITPADLRALVALEASLVVVDGVTEAMVLHGLSPDSNPDVAAFFGMFARPLADAGAGVAFIDHVTKAKETRGRWAIGAQHKMSGLNGASYNIEVVEPFGYGKHGVAKITLSKDRLGPVRGIQDELHRVAELHLQSEDDGTVTAQLRPPYDDTRSTVGFRPTKIMENISRFLESAPGGGELSGRTVETSVRGRAEYIRLALELLSVEGYVVAKKSGRAFLYRSIRPFREEPEAAGGDLPDRGEGS